MITTSGLAFALFASTSVAQVITPQENKIFQHAANVISDESYWSVRFIFWMMTSFYLLPHSHHFFFSPCCRTWPKNCTTTVTPPFHRKSCPTLALRPFTTFTTNINRSRGKNWPCWPIKESLRRVRRGNRESLPTTHKRHKSFNMQNKLLNENLRPVPQNKKENWRQEQWHNLRIEMRKKRLWWRRQKKNKKSLKMKTNCCTCCST